MLLLWERSSMQYVVMQYNVGYSRLFSKERIGIQKEKEKSVLLEESKIIDNMTNQINDENDILILLQEKNNVGKVSMELNINQNM